MRLSKDIEDVLDLLELASDGTEEAPGPWTVERLRWEVFKRTGGEMPTVFLDEETTVGMLLTLVQSIELPAEMRVRVRVQETPD